MACGEKDTPLKRVELAIILINGIITEAITKKADNKLNIKKNHEDTNRIS